MQKTPNQPIINSFAQIIEDLFFQFLEDIEGFYKQFEQTISKINQNPQEIDKKLDFSFALDSFNKLNLKFLELQRGEYKLNPDWSTRANMPLPKANTQKKTLDLIKSSCLENQFKIDLKSIRSEILSKTEESTKIEEKEENEIRKERKETEERKEREEREERKTDL